MRYRKKAGIPSCRKLMDDEMMKLYLKDVASGVVLLRPPEASQDLNDFVSLQDAEQSVQKDFQPNGKSLAAVQDETGNVERYVQLNWLNSSLTKNVSESQFVQCCNRKRSNNWPDDQSQNEGLHCPLDRLHMNERAYCSVIVPGHEGDEQESKLPNLL
ncbi:unnamed protein product [Nesidiocoris tenuis]|uniref:Uncharacterized protein n=1 Tax=Nesidiocoris tenuis TaxID=355587 RepID=A0A6H5H1K1_9HEMI|nr:unnamed protein product [Nesidiocoris tenuis]